MQWDYLTEKQYRALQDRAVRRFIAEEAYPFHPHYGALMRKLGIRPRDIQRASDFAKLPEEFFTTKKKIAENPEAFVLRPTPKTLLLAPPRTRAAALVLREAVRKAVALPNFALDQTLNRCPWLLYRVGRIALPEPRPSREIIEERYVPHFPTGTTGRSTGGVPTVFWFTPKDLERLARLGPRYFAQLALQDLPPEARRGLDVFPVAIHLADLFLREVSRGVPAMVFPTGGGKGLGTERSARIAEAAQVRLIAGVPDYVENMLRRAESEGRNLAYVERVILGGDAVGPKRRQNIIELLRRCGAKNPAVVASYGFTEAKTAFVECAEGAREGGMGYHFLPELGVIELVKPDEQGRAQACWSTIVGAGTVVLRYLTGDYFTALTYDPCPACKRTLPRIVGPIIRKTSDMVKNFRGTVVDFNNVCPIFENDEEIVEWEIVLSGTIGEDDERMDCFVALHERAEEQQVKARVAQQFRVVADGPSFNTIVIESREALERRLGIETELKAQRIKDLRKEA